MPRLELQYGFATAPVAPCARSDWANPLCPEKSIDGDECKDRRWPCVGTKGVDLTRKQLQRMIGQRVPLSQRVTRGKASCLQGECSQNYEKKLHSANYLSHVYWTRIHMEAWTLTENCSILIALQTWKRKRLDIWGASFRVICLAMGVGLWPSAAASREYFTLTLFA